MGTGRTIVVAALTAAIISTATFFALRTLTGVGGVPAEEAEVPPLAGLRPDQARRLLEPRGLLFVIAEQREDVKAEAGTIVQQTPLEGSRLKRGAEVRVVLATGATKVEVPPLARLPLAGAMQALASAGLKLGAVTRQPSAEPPDQVLSSIPASGERVARDTAVALVVAATPDDIKVPNVVGKMLKQATAELQQAGLKPGKVTYGFDEDRRGGVVIRQSPAADTRAAKDTAVNLVVNESD